MFSLVTGTNLGTITEGDGGGVIFSALLATAAKRSAHLKKIQITKGQ